MTAAETARKPMITVNGDPREVQLAVKKIITDYNKSHIDNPLAVIHGGTVCTTKDQENRLAISPITVDELREKVHQIADFAMALKKGDLKQVLPPYEHLKLILAAQDSPFPILESTMPHPYFNPDSKLISKAGYDPKYKIWLEQEKPVKIYDLPTLKEATDIIDDLFFNFPFQSDSDKENLIALPLWLITSEMIGGRSPIFGLEANSPGTGKDLAFDTAVFPILGKPVNIIGEITNPDEMRKTLLSIVADDTRLVVFGNLNQSFNSGELAGFVTSEYYSGRWLGKTKTATFKNECTVGYSANNAEMSLEIARRNVRCKLMSDVSRPWEIDVNQFKHPNLMGYTRKKRNVIFSAYVKIVQNWIEAGKPDWTGKPLGSFETFSRGIGGILECAGYTHFMENRLAIFNEADSESMVFGEFLAAWWERFSNSPVKVSMLFPIAQNVDGFDMGDKSAQGQKITLGKMIHKRRDTILDSLRIRSAGEAQNTAKWRLEKISL